MRDPSFRSKVVEADSLRRAGILERDHQVAVQAEDDADATVVAVTLGAERAIAVMHMQRDYLVALQLELAEAILLLRDARIVVNMDLDFLVIHICSSFKVGIGRKPDRQG